MSDLDTDSTPVCGDLPCLHAPAHVTVAQDREANPQDYDEHKHQLDTRTTPDEIVLFSDSAVGIWSCDCGYRFPRPLSSGDRQAG